MRHRRFEMRLGEIRGAAAIAAVEIGQRFGRAGRAGGAHDRDWSGSADDRASSPARCHSSQAPLPARFSRSSVLPRLTSAPAWVGRIASAAHSSPAPRRGGQARGRHWRGYREFPDDPAQAAARCGSLRSPRQSVRWHEARAPDSTSHRRKPELTFSAADRKCSASTMRWRWKLSMPSRCSASKSSGRCSRMPAHSRSVLSRSPSWNASVRLPLHARQVRDPPGLVFPISPTRGVFPDAAARRSESCRLRISLAPTQAIAFSSGVESIAADAYTRF